MPPVKLLDQVLEQLRLKHYSYRTEETYIHWIKRYILFHSKRHPNEMGDDEIRAFLIHLSALVRRAQENEKAALAQLESLVTQARESTGIDIRLQVPASSGT